MKYLFTFLFSFLLFTFTFAQTPDEIMREAYPEEPVITELSGFELLWRDMIYAKQKGDNPNYFALVEQIKNEYPERFVNSEYPVPITFATQEQVDAFNANNIPDSEMQLFTGNVATYGTATHTGGNPRTVRIRSAPDGTQYLTFGPASNDTFYVYRSTNAGTSWSLFTFGASPGNTGRGLDFYITDTTGTYRIGIIVSTETSTALGLLSFFTFSPASPLPVYATTVALPVSGRGLIHPVIVSDGYYYSPATTHWYIAYQDYSSGTPTNNPVRAALTTDWGQTWTFTTARTGFNDYDVDIEFRSHASPGVDSIYVLLSNNLTLTNPNLRIRRVALSNWTGTFSQFNPATTSDPEFHGLIKVDRATGEMICTFTRTTAGVNHVAYVYARPGAQYFTPTTPTYIAQNPYNEGGLTVHCIEGQSLWRFVYLASGAAKDTIIFKWSFDLATGVEGHIVVNPVNNSSNQIFPSIAGHPSLAATDVNNYGSGIVFAGAGNSGLFYHNIPDAIIPVELSAFSGWADGNSAYLSWQTSTETNNRGFEVQRMTDNEFVSIGFIEGYGTTTEKQYYSFVDLSLSPGSYSYRLKQIDFDGSYNYSNVIEVIVLPPDNFSLSQNYPNPFNPATTINYTIPSASSVMIELFSINGERVSTLVNSNQESGYYTLELNSNRYNLASGVYFYRMTAVDISSGKQFIDTRKLVLMK